VPFVPFASVRRVQEAIRWPDAKSPNRNAETLPILTPQIWTGSYFLATYVAGTLFDQEARKFKHGACKGPACFRLAFIVIAAFSLVALLLSMVLHRRTRHLYHRVVEDTKAERMRRGREATPPPTLPPTPTPSPSLCTPTAPLW